MCLLWASNAWFFKACSIGTSAMKHKHTHTHAAQRMFIKDKKIKAVTEKVMNSMKKKRTKSQRRPFKALQKDTTFKPLYKYGFILKHLIFLGNTVLIFVLA